MRVCQGWRNEGRSENCVELHLYAKTQTFSRIFYKKFVKSSGGSFQFNFCYQNKNAWDQATFTIDIIERVLIILIQFTSILRICQGRSNEGRSENCEELHLCAKTDSGWVDKRTIYNGCSHRRLFFSFFLHFTVSQSSIIMSGRPYDQSRDPFLHFVVHSD